MKRFVSLMILFVIFSAFIVTAGDVLKLDFAKQNQHIIGLKKGDRAEFYLNGERNIIIIDKVKPNSVDITAFIALNTRNYPYYTTLSRDRTLKIDVERDDIGDLYVGWYGGSKDLKYAYLLLKKPKIISATGNVTVDEIKREKRVYDKYVIGGFIFSIILLVFLILKYKKSDNVE